MGTKRPSCTLFDTVSNINTSDRKLQPGGKVSRDPSPRPAMTAQSERDRDGGRNEDWRREREMDKARYRDMDPRDQYYERDRAPAPRTREGERELRERDRRQGDVRSKNGRPLSNLEKETEREADRGMKKGDTFPRMRRNSADRSNRMTATTEMDDERGERRHGDRPKRQERDDWERERERERAGYRAERDRYRVRDRDEIRSRAKEEGQSTGRRSGEDEKSRQRERYQEFDAGFQDRRREVGDSWDRKEKHASRKRENPRSDMGKRGNRVSSPDRRRDREERTMAHRREGWRGTRSEGENDEREMGRERKIDREREELQYQHSRSEGDNVGDTKRDRDHDRYGYRDEDRQRYRDRDRDREREVDRSRRREAEKNRERHREGHRRAAREADREGEKWKEGRDVKDDKRRYDRYREYGQERGRESKERDVDPRWDDSTGRSSRSMNETSPRRPPRAQSSEEWSTTESPERVAEGSHREKKRSERPEKDRGETTGSVPEQRRMWLEPRRDKNSKDEFVDRERRTRESIEPQAEGEREGKRVKQGPDESYLDQSSYRGRHRGGSDYRTDTVRETGGVSVVGEEVGDVWRQKDKGGKEQLSDSDGVIEGSWRRDAEGESVTDNTEESDREEEGGSDYWARSESEGGSETGWKQEKDRMLSGEDGFVTVSSGGDEENEREEDDEAFVDCQDFLEGGPDDPLPSVFKGCEEENRREREEWTMGKEETVDEDDQGREKQKYIFCVIGQTLPRSKTKEKSPSQVDQERGVVQNMLSLRSRHHDSDEATWESQDDQHTTLSRDDEYLVTNQDTEREYYISRTERTAMRETTESTETGDRMRGKKEHPYAEIGPINRDSQTERLLVEWREKNKESEREREPSLPIPSNPYADVCSQVDLQIQPILDRIDTGSMSQEEVEAIRIRLSSAWSMSEEPKRHSQAPHLKWAKDVVREILGKSEEKQFMDESNAEAEAYQGVGQSDIDIQNYEEQADFAQETGEVPDVTLRMDKEHSDPELKEEEEEPLDVEGLRGMGQSQADMHADQLTSMHGDAPTYTHVDILLDADGKEEHSAEETEPSSDLWAEKSVINVNMSEAAGDQLSETEEKESKQREVEMYLSVSNKLYKPNSCPILSYETKSILSTSREGEGQEVEDREGESEEERQEEESDERDTTGKAATEGEVESKEVAAKGMKGRAQLKSSCSFQDLGPEVRLRRRGIRKTTERRGGEHVEVKEEEGVGRDRRTRIFSSTDDEDDGSKSWGEIDLRNVLETIERRKRNSKFFNAAQLYQQYSEAAQNFEILRQARSDITTVCEGSTQSPASSPPPARRPLPPLPTVPHPHSLSHAGSITSVRSLPLPEPPKSEGRPSSPRLSLSLTQSSTLWQDLPGVRNSIGLDELTEDQRRLQEIRFEVVTSEASYCRSLDIVVEQFVKSKQLGVLLTTQDRNWLFSRLADVRAISHSFLSKLEEAVELNIMSFTVCDIIARHCQRFKMVYVPYLTNQSYQDATYQRLMNENPGFKRIVEKLERSPICQRLPLRSFLVLPFQRITRIKLLVQNIVKRTTPGTAEATQAIKSLKLLEKLIQESNDSITLMKSIESLVSLSAKVDFECRTLPLISQSRRLVREGLVTELIDFSLKDTERNIYLHQFNDYLLVSLQKEGGRFTVIDHSPVSDLRVENCRVKLHSLQKNLFRLHMSNKALLLRTDTQSDKLRWISALSQPHPEIDFSAAQDFPQMQCIRAFVAQQPDELSMEKADIILVHQQSSDHWVEGTRLSDRHRGWVPESHLENISNSRVRQRNLSDALKLTTATAAV